MRSLLQFWQDEDGLSFIPMPYPEVSWLKPTPEEEARERRALGLDGLGQYTISPIEQGGATSSYTASSANEAQISSAKMNYESLNRALQDLIAERSALVNDWGARTKQGASPAELTYKLNQLDTDIMNWSTKVNQAQQEYQAALSAPATAAPATGAAEESEATRKSLQEYVKQIYLLRQGGFYDFGAGANRRNAFYYGDRGLGLIIQEEAMDANEAQEGLGVDFFAALQEAVKSKEVQQQFSTLKSPITGVTFGGPKVQVPSWLSQFAKPVTTLAKTVAAKAKSQPQSSAAPATSPTGEEKVIFAPLQTTGLSLPLIGAGVAILAIGFLALRRK